jgi:ubiquinone biosynthesis protein
MKSIQVQDLGRVRDIISVMAKYGFGQLFSGSGLPDPSTNIDADADADADADTHADIASSPRAQRLRDALIELGPTWIKLGQVLSVRPDILPTDIMHEFQSLQDRVPPMTMDQVRQVLLEELTMPMEDVFSEFDEEPLGSASIAQVHRARLHDGQEVAIKLQRQGIAKKIRSDMHILYTIASAVEKRLSLPGLHTPSMIVREFDVAITNELDFSQEMRAADRFYRNFKDNDDVVIPRVYPRWSTRRMLCMDLVPGVPLKEKMNVDKVTPESRKLAHALMEVAYLQVFEHGFFHGDPHPGNLFVTDDNKIAILDFGLTGSLTGQMQDTIIQAFTSMVFRDADTLAMTIYQSGATTDRVDLRAFRNEIERLMDKYYGMSLEDLTTDKGTMMEVIQTASRFHINVPTEFAVLSRTFGLTEGTLRALLPGVDIVEEVKPYAQRLVAARLSPERVAIDVARAMVQLQGQLKGMPTQLNQVMMDLEAGHIKFTIEDNQARALREEIRMGGLRIALALFASTTTLGALLFLAAWSPAPFGIPLFGLFGLVLAMFGSTLFGALGLHVFFARYLSLSFWRRILGRIVRFFSWRRRE